MSNDFDKVVDDQYLELLAELEKLRKTLITVAAFLRPMVSDYPDRDELGRIFTMVDDSLQTALQPICDQDFEVAFCPNCLVNMVISPIYVQKLIAKDLFCQCGSLLLWQEGYANQETEQMWVDIKQQ